VVELRDVFTACCHTETERDCLRLREEGYTFKEIGRRLDMPLSTANLMFRRLQNRIFSAWEAP
jgi:hypothetical protein